MVENAGLKVVPQNAHDRGPSLAFRAAWRLWRPQRRVQYLLSTGFVLGRGVYRDPQCSQVRAGGRLSE